MIKSMTGYCKVEVEHQGKTCTIELRSVNHRFLDARVFLPKAFSTMEEDLKKRLRSFVNRGKVDASLTLTSESAEEDRLMVDPLVMKNLKKTLSGFEAELKQPVSVALSDLLQVKGLIKYGLSEGDEYDYAGLFAKAVDQGGAGLQQMRETEGRLLNPVLRQHLDQLGKLIKAVPPLALELQAHAQNRLSQALTKLGLTLDVEDPRVMQEIGFQLDRADITEEIERFEAHLRHFDEILEADEPVGRKLDFLTQELNREANTLCSKSSSSKITEIGVNLKTELEKLREQIQNIE